MEGEIRYLFSSASEFEDVVVETSNRGGNVTPLHRLTRITIHTSTWWMSNKSVVLNVESCLYIMCIMGILSLQDLS